MTYESEKDTKHPRHEEALLGVKASNAAIRWTSNVNCDNTRKLGRIDESDRLFGADEG